MFNDEDMWYDGVYVSVQGAGKWLQAEAEYRFVGREVRGRITSISTAGAEEIAKTWNQRLPAGIYLIDNPSAHWRVTFWTPQGEDFSMKFMGVLS